LKLTITTDKWLFLVFYWTKSGSNISINIFCPDIPSIQKDSIGPASPYVMPLDIIQFADGMDGYFYEIQVFEKAIRAITTDLVI